MTRPLPESETAIAAVMVQHFLDLGAEVYQEVAMGSRADIVAKTGPVLHVIEVKTSMSLWLIEQGWWWLPHAHRVSIAVPNYKTGKFAEQICKRFGVGLYSVQKGSGPWVEAHAREIVKPVFRRAVSNRLAKALRPEQQTYAPAGNSGGKFWSPRKAVVAALREVVAAQPGMTWREAMSRISHHYQSDSSAASTFARIYANAAWRRSTDLDWLAVTDERPMRLYLAGAVPLSLSQGSIE